jgi:hypothetical protein
MRFANRGVSISSLYAALSIKGVYQTGYIVLGLTGLSTVGLLML